MKTSLHPLIQQLKKGAHISLSENETATDEATDNSTAADQPGEQEDKTPGQAGSNKVVVRLYMESQCPACKAYSTNFIKKLLETPNVQDIVDFKFVPWGNGNIKNAAGESINTTETLSAAIADENDDAALRNLSFFCQHGGSECAGNAYESCIQDLYPDQGRFFPVIDCIEKRSCAEGQKPPACNGPPAAVAGDCVKEFGPDMDRQALRECMHSTKANRLLLANALETAQLDPPHAWVPWVTIDGKNLGGPDPSTFTDMFLIGDKVCEAFANKTGQTPPAECASFPATPPANPYGEEVGGGKSDRVNWWIVGVSLVAFMGAIVALYFVLYQAKGDDDAMEPLHRDSSEWGGVERVDG